MDRTALADCPLRKLSKLAAGKCHTGKTPFKIDSHPVLATFLGSFQTAPNG